MGNTHACCSSDSGTQPESLWDGDVDQVSVRGEQGAMLAATPPPCDGTLIVNVVSCANLGCLPTIKSGHKAPDTYVRLHLGSANQVTQQTSVVERSCDPSFDESFEFRLAGGSSHAASTLFVAVLAKGRLGVRTSNNMLGEAQISLRDVFCGRWTERIGGQWALRDDYTRAVAKQRSESSGQAALGTIELQLRFRPDVPAGLGLKLLPRSKRPTAVLPPCDDNAVQSSQGSINSDMQLVPPPSDGWLRVHIRRCDGLLPMRGETGSFVSLSVGGGESVQTSVQFQTLCPHFDQQFEFFLDGGAPPGSCVLLLKVKSTTNDFLGELELQPCKEFAKSNWQHRVKREFALTDRLNRAPAREKKKRIAKPCPCGTVALTLTFEPVVGDSPWEALTPASWHSGYVRPDLAARVHTEGVRAGRLPPTHIH